MAQSEPKLPPAKLPLAKLPLEGIRVLDSTYVFALPYAGGLMADFGAEVIKIEGPSRPRRFPGCSAPGSATGSAADRDSR